MNFLHRLTPNVLGLEYIMLPSVIRISFITTPQTKEFLSGTILFIFKLATSVRTGLAYILGRKFNG